jgi:MOSC domain-containing protein YiiM
VLEGGRLRVGDSVEIVSEQMTRDLRECRSHARR